MRSLTLVVTMASLIVVSSVAAQADQASLVGRRVRITTSNPTPPGDRQRVPRVAVIGELTGTSDSTLSLRREATDDEVTVPLSRVQRLEMSTGSDRGASGRKGAIIGLAIGAVAGFAAGDDCSEDEFMCFPRSQTAMGGAAAGVTLGFIIGLIAGGGERWEDAAIPRVSVDPTSARSLSIGSTIRFGGGRR